MAVVAGVRRLTARFFSTCARCWAPKSAQTEAQSYLRFDG